MLAMLAKAAIKGVVSVVAGLFFLDVSLYVIEKNAKKKEIQARAKAVQSSLRAHIFQ